MKTKERQLRADSAEAMVIAAGNAALGHHPVPATVELGDDERRYWPMIMRGRARDEWKPADLLIAAELCRVWARIEANNRALIDEGDVIENKRGNLVPNPRANILDKLHSRQGQMFRLLQMHPLATGDREAIFSKRQLEDQAQAAKEEAEAEADEDDGLLA